MISFKNSHNLGKEAMLERGLDSHLGYDKYSKTKTSNVRNVFPDSRTQICVIHQIRNACRYVVQKDKKEFAIDMKEIYGALTKQVA